METARDHAPGATARKQKIQESTAYSGEVSLVRNGIHTRCPSCQKLYVVDPPAPNSGVPRFECTSCRTVFSLQPVSEVVIAPKNATRRVPKSVAKDASKNVAKDALARQAPNAGLDIVAAQEAEQFAAELALGAKPELVILWKDVLDDYANEDRHDTFILACWRLDALPFAAQKYARIIAAHPGEEIARKMRNCIIQISTQKLEGHRRSTASPAASPRTERTMRFPGFNSLAIMLGAAVFVIGLAIPGLNNMAGVGFSLTTLAVSLRFFVRP